MLGLKKEELEKVEKNKSKFHKILKGCLKIKEEQILIISDYGSEDRNLAMILAYGYHLAAKDKGMNSTILLQQVKQGFMRADDHILKALELLENNSIIILCLSNKLGRLGDLGKSFRNFCKEKGHRFISTTSLHNVNASKFDIFMEAIDINYNRLNKKASKLKTKLDRAKTIRIKTEKGTDITFDVEKKEAKLNTGSYSKPGTGGNIPAGEVYIPPRGMYGVEGVVIIDGSMRHDGGTQLLDEPLKLVIKEGRVMEIEGKYKELMEKTLTRHENRAKYPERVRMIGELGIGINPGAILVGSSILDEKVLGTAHIAIGSNYWFGGDIRTVFHADQIFMNPRIFIDGEELKV